MATNFYFISEDETIDRHIGKRSAAGYFCWDCGISLNASGNHMVHCGGRLLKSCAICGKKPQKESLGNSSAGRELGFNKKRPKRKDGVESCCSFSFAMSPGSFADIKTAPNMHIEDEYGRRYSMSEFSDVLSECPIKFFAGLPLGRRALNGRTREIEREY